MSASVLTKIAPRYLSAAGELRDNPGQWQAYESTGNCVILAGPGSGKTKTLTTKIARLLAEDIVPPRGIACITYNTECAGELKRRLDDLGVREAKNRFIGTIHSFCLKNVLLPYGRLARIGLPDEISVASPSEQDRYFERAVDKVFGGSARPEAWRTGFDRYRRTYLDRQSRDWKGRDHDTAVLIETYEHFLRHDGLIDFDDMVLLGLQLIEKHDWVRKALKARFPVLAIDEYQDLGLPLHRIATSLCFGAGVRLIAVGDPDQSIYGFTGANPELLNELADTECIEKIPLRFNYRSGETLVEASKVALGEKRDYVAKGGYAGTIDFYEFPEGLDQQAENTCTEIIPEALKRRDARQLGDVAVLYLDKNDGDVIEQHALAAGMKCIRMDRGAPYRKTPLIRWLEECAAWCAGGWAKGAPRLSDLIGSWLAFNDARTDSEIDRLRVKLVKFLSANRNSDEHLADWLVAIEGSCLLPLFTETKTLRDEVESFEILKKASQPVGRLEDFTVGLFGGQSGAADHLNLITLHSAKGREFDVVVMMGMDQGKIPSWSARTPDAKRETRRLFYVGLTRARHEVHMTFSGFTVDKYNRRHENGPSEFMLEVMDRMKRK